MPSFRIAKSSCRVWPEVTRARTPSVAYHSRRDQPPKDRAAHDGRPDFQRTLGLTPLILKVCALPSVHAGTDPWRNLRYTALASAVSSAEHQDRMIHIKPNQILCTIIRCSKPANFVLHRFLGSAKPVRLAYCNEHAQQVATDLDIKLPEHD
jgi:hypothetical protein